MCVFGSELRGPKTKIQDGESVNLECGVKRLRSRTIKGCKTISINTLRAVNFGVAHGEEKPAIFGTARKFQNII